MVILKSIFEEIQNEFERRKPNPVFLQPSNQCEASKATEQRQLVGFLTRSGSERNQAPAWED